MPGRGCARGRCGYGRARRQPTGTAGHHRVYGCTSCNGPAHDYPARNYYHATGNNDDEQGASSRCFAFTSGIGAGKQRHPLQPGGAGHRPRHRRPLGKIPHITGGPGTHILAGAIDPYTGVFRSTGTLFPSTTYTVSFVVAGNVGTDTGLTPTGTRTFVTPAPSSAESVTANVFPTPGIAVGIGEPIIFMFSQPIDTYAAQQSVLSHLHISMSKPVPGGWHWFSSVELHFRPAHYWPVGEGVSVSGDLADWDVGGGNWGVGTLTTSFIIGESRISR